VDINLTIGAFCEEVEEYKNIQLLHNQEIDISDLECYVPTPAGHSRIDYIIKKENITGLTITLENGIEIKCAKKHILIQYGSDVYADSLCVGDIIDTINGQVKILQISDLLDTTFYDIGIASPHLYYDPDGVLHHNTIMTAALSKSVEQYGRSIVIVPNKSLVTQTEADYINLGLDVGVYFGDRKEWGKTHTICTWQSLNVLLKNTQAGIGDVTIGEFIEDVVLVMVDEVHMAKADALKTLLTGVFARVPLRWGLTGTIPKEDYERVSIFCSLGNVVGKLSASELQEAGHLANCHVNIVQLQDSVEYRDYQSELKYLTTTTERLAYLARMIDQIKESGNTLILVDRIETGKILQAELSSLFSLLGDKPEVAFVSGSTKAGDRKDEYDEIATATNKIIIATYGVAAVGINIPRIFNLVLIEPGKSFVRVIQSIGRGIRKASDKDFVQIWDITSTCKFAKRHLTARKRFYSEANYPFTVEKAKWQ
jgi:superfamily II DNA or RNA helicase